MPLLWVPGWPGSRLRPSWAIEGNPSSSLIRSPKDFGGQAFWSLGDLFTIDTPEQRRMGIRDSQDPAMRDWLGSAQFDRLEDDWPRKWAERGGSYANRHGNSVPRFHITWGTGPGVIEHFVRRVKEYVSAGRITLKFRHQVDRSLMENGAAKGISGTCLAEDTAERGQKTNRDSVGDFELHAPSVIVTSGGIGGNFEMIRQNWPRERLGAPPKEMVAGCRSM